jgi:hypothetical protein
VFSKPFRLLRSDGSMDPDFGIRSAESNKLLGML